MDQLFEGVTIAGTKGDVTGTEVTSIEFDSRDVTPGALFFCLPGHRTDGHDFAAPAVTAGAVGLMVERPLAVDVAQVLVVPGTARAAMAEAAATFYGHPARALTTVAVTGTNGKTSVTRLLASILDADGRSCAVVGTLDGVRTTPEAPVIEKILAEARGRGQRAAALEVSSHALSEGRVDGIRFDVAVFTNLSHDHLDYHGTMEAYFEAKASLFDEARAARAVINGDDAWGRRLVEQTTIPVATYSAADATVVDSTSAGRTTFVWRGRTVSLALTGAYHVTNALAAATAASVLGVTDDTVVAGLEQADEVPGRFEVVSGPAPFTVVVDYAHTPDGLAVALDSARRLAGAGRVLCVFGCGGDRDRAKRPVMGRVASEAADVTVITSDNPRHEKADAIIDDVRAGVGPEAAVVIEPDRARAIAAAVDMARPGDVVLVAGKGHEEVVEIGDQRIPFDDRRVAAEAVQQRGLVAGTGAANAGEVDR